MADFTIVSSPVLIRFQCPFCESEEEIPWEEVKHPDYWGDEWDDIECPSCGKMVSLGEWIMTEYIEREALMKNFCGYDLTKCVKYGNESAEQQHDSYSTMMMYEIADEIEDAPTIDAVPVVRCRECKYSTLPSELTQRYGKPGTLTCHNMHAPSNKRNVGSNDFCSYGERKEGACND